MTTKLDSNTWYNVRYADAASTKGMMAQDINQSGTGGIIQYALNYTTSNAYQWQFLPIGPTNTYILRSRLLGNQWSMGVFWAPLATLPGMDTRIRTENYRSPDLVPKTAQWIVESTNDGTGMFYLSAVANGTATHLENYQNILYLRDASSGSTTNGMKWALSSVSAIDDAQWSYSATSATASATSTALPTASSTPASNAATTTSTASSDQQSSSVAARTKSPTAAIAGGVVGGIAVLLLILGAFWWFRKRKRAPKSSMYKSPASHSTELEAQQPYSTQYSGNVKIKPGIYEKALSPYDERGTASEPQRAPAELPAEAGTYNSYHP